MPEPSLVSLYARVCRILESARVHVARSVNTSQVVAYWLVGREIVEEEQKGRHRAAYGDRLLLDLAGRLRRDYGPGYSISHLKNLRAFYIGFPALFGSWKSHALRSLLELGQKSHAPRGLLRASRCSRSHRTARVPPADPPVGIGGLIGQTAGDNSWRPGRIHANLSWTHYRTLLRVGRADARAFYEIEAIRNNWSARELERQIASLLFDRLARSRDKRGLLRLATQGQQITRATDAFKDPVVIEFLGLPASPRLTETEVEQALITNLQSFLLEMGKGFAFVSRQERITLDGDHFYLDLVFYHTVLKCYVLIDLKVGKLTHADLGQLQLYVNYYDRECRTPGDQPTLGLILCTDKNVSDRPGAS
jgi:predicted nuclease of restriction endonuclease-like (RecB) superfamily